MKCRESKTEQQTTVKKKFLKFLPSDTKTHKTVVTKIMYFAQCQTIDQWKNLKFQKQTHMEIEF